MVQEPDVNPASGEENLRSAILNVTSELEYEKNHALFLGYKVNELESHILSLVPENADRLWWWWLIKRDHGILAQRIMNPAKPSALRTDCLEFVNLVNLFCETVCLTLETGKDGEHQIIAKSFLEGQYDRANFTIFMERINQELTHAVNNSSVLELWRKIGDVG